MEEEEEQKEEVRWRLKYSRAVKRDKKKEGREGEEGKEECAGGMKKV